MISESDEDDALLILDARDRVRSATPRALALLGMPVGELVGRPWSEITRPEDVTACVRTHTLQSRSRRSLMRVVTLASASLVGAHDHLISAWADSSELACVRGPEGRFLAVNSAFARKFGSAAPAWTGREPADLIHSDDVEDWRVSLNRLGRPAPRVTHEHRWLTAQGWRWLSWEEQVVRAPSGIVLATRAIGRDVTKRRLAEEHFHKLANIVEQSPLSVVLTMPDGRVEYVNPRFTQATGYTLEEIFEQRIEVLRAGFTTAADYAEFLAVVRSGRSWRGEFQTVSKTGQTRWEVAQVAAIRNHQDRITHLLCLREDITERKQLEHQLRHAQKMECLGTLAGGISHDFNNLLAIISGFCEMSLLRSPADATLTRYLREIHGATTRASGLVRQILSFSRKPEGGARPMDLNQLVDELVRMFRETFPRQIEFIIEPDKDLPALSADSNQLQQVVMNLCVNARDALGVIGGKITIRTRCHSGAEISRLGADPTAQYATLEIADNGCGMTNEVRARIFEPFFTTKDKNSGTGLGLAVVYGIVTGHGGLLDVRSAPGEGTTFLIHLPLPPDVMETVITERVEPVALPPGTESVLVVEDEPGVRSLLQSALNNAGYKVFCAADGAEAVEFLMGRADPVDVVLLDLNLPRISGMQVRDLLRQTRPSTRLIIASGHVPPEFRRAIESAGDAEIIAKPFSLATLGVVLRQVLDRAPTLAALR